MQQFVDNGNPWTRRVLICVMVACGMIAVVDRMRVSAAQRPPFDVDSSLALRLHEAKGYGNATIRIGDGQLQSFSANTPAVVTAIRQAADESGCCCILLRISGGVRQGEVQRLHDVVAQAVGDRNLDIYLALADEQPEIFERTDSSPDTKDE